MAILHKGVPIACYMTIEKIVSKEKRMKIAIDFLINAGLEGPLSHRGPKIIIKGINNTIWDF